MKSTFFLLVASLLMPEVFPLAYKTFGISKGKNSSPTTTTTAKSDIQSSTKQPKPVRRQKWGVDNTHPEEYWFDERIHTLGNVGFWGALHAALAPMSTKLIDVLAYDGVDIRQKVRVRTIKVYQSGRGQSSFPNTVLIYLVVLD